VTGAAQRAIVGVGGGEMHSTALSYALSRVAHTFSMGSRWNHSTGYCTTGMALPSLFLFFPTSSPFQILRMHFILGKGCSEHTNYNGKW